MSALSRLLGRDVRGDRPHAFRPADGGYGMGAGIGLGPRAVNTPLAELQVSRRGKAVCGVPGCGKARDDEIHAS
jgi:hypothetical protein